MSNWPRLLFLCRGHQESVGSVAFSPDGKHIVSGSEDETIRIWDADTGQSLMGPLEGHQDSVWSVAFSPDGKRIVSGSEDKTIRIWDADTGQSLMGPLEGHQD
jgi:WD40 repeat protein